MSQRPQHLVRDDGRERLARRLLQCKLGDRVATAGIPKPATGRLRDPHPSGPRYARQRPFRRRQRALERQARIAVDVNARGVAHESPKRYAATIELRSRQPPPTSESIDGRIESDAATQREADDRVRCDRLRDRRDLHHGLRRHRASRGCVCKPVGRGPTDRSPLDYGNRRTRDVMGAQGARNDSLDLARQRRNIPRLVERGRPPHPPSDEPSADHERSDRDEHRQQPPPPAGARHRHRVQATRASVYTAIRHASRSGRPRGAPVD